MKESDELKGRPSRLFHGRASPDVLELARALRPLRRRVHSRCKRVMVPARERWLDLALVVSLAPWAGLWDQMVHSLWQLMEGLGAFRDVDIWELAEAPLRLRTRGGLSQSPRELIDPSGRRLIILVTDGLGAGWRSGEVVSLLDEWGKAGPVALFQVLPQGMWQRTGLRGYSPAQLRAPTPGAPNARFQVELRYVPQGQVRTEQTRVAVPLLTPERALLAPWARMVAHGGDVAVYGLVLTKKEQGGAEGNAQYPIGPEERVDRFYANASPLAQDLAELLATVPLNRPLMRLVKQVLEPDARSSHWAESFMGEHWAWAVAHGDDAGAHKLVMSTRGQGDGEGDARCPIGPQERMERFYASASPLTWDLAGLLAAVPLNWPLIRLVQQMLGPAADPSHLAEIFMAELLREVKQTGTEGTPNEVQYDFREGVREMLLAVDGKRVWEAAPCVLRWFR